jgi:plastocyanin
MKTQSRPSFRKLTSIIWVIVFLAALSVAQAATHVIKFGSTLGSTYSPNTLNAVVGDTIQWEGSFSFHPLSSTSVPAGAQSFHQASGSVFSYPVTVGGTYLYQCDAHVGIGMAGSFSALTATSVENIQNASQLNDFKLGQNYPNPFNPSTMISFSIPFQTFVSIKVYNLIGEEIATIVNENMAAGSYSRLWSAASIPSGVYFYRMQAGNYTSMKKLVLMK